jgi:hypothetical protein
MDGASWWPRTPPRVRLIDLLAVPSDIESEGGADTPEGAVLRGFAPDDRAAAIEVDYISPDHAVVTVGFPGKSSHYIQEVHRFEDGWRLSWFGER